MAIQSVESYLPSPIQTETPKKLGHLALVPQIPIEQQAYRGIEDCDIEDDITPFKVLKLLEM